jgi:peptidoglycan/LPS O-acetylase OafA/YrhL
MYVVLHHAWIRVWPAYPSNDGPTWLGWLMPGQLGVVAFIVVSGYSLSVRPARHGGRLPEGKSGFARRRAWRIIPPYWAALVLSTLVVNLVLSQRTGVTVDLRSFLVNAFLVQDVFGNTTPNGAFWSIAIEAQIYLIFPLMLWAVRRWSVVLVTVTVALAVCAAHVLAAGLPALRKIDDLTPQLFACFALGVAAAMSRSGTKDSDRRPRWPAAVVAVATLAYSWWIGTVAMYSQFFWVDIAVGAATALLFWSLSTWAARIGGFLAWRPLRLLGQFSYSIYLIHAPILGIVYLFVVSPLKVPPLSAFLLTLGFGVPAALGFAYGFFWLFERPFLTIRSWRGLGSWLHVDWWRPGRASPVRHANAPVAARVPDAEAATDARDG